MGDLPREDSGQPEYLKAPGKRWSCLGVLGEYRIPKDGVAGRRELERAVEERRAAETGADYKAMAGVVFWGETVSPGTVGK